MAHRRDLIIGVTPVGRPDSSIALAVARAGGLGVLDLGRERQAGLDSLALLAGEPGPFGALVQSGAPFGPGDLADNVDTVIVPAGEPIGVWAPRRVLVQCVCLEEALAAVAEGAHGIIAKGTESGGRAGDESSFVLLQRLVKAIETPVWVQGGVGQYTAGASIAGGARGVVLDVQLSLLRESTLDPAVRTIIASMDGSGTTLADGERRYIRPGDALRAAATEAAPALPIGQDAAFARPFAERYGTAAKLVKALQASIVDAVEGARDEMPLRAGSPFAAQHRLRYPIAQGPMTRVSDTPEFAEAVAEGGALPFIALALMRGPEVRELLEATRARLGERPWGVGILGFVPPVLREEQIEAIREVRPPVALIAGGRPSQARPLEELGIPTYLHVPSPGLLDMFLKQGARRFVFEGQECGGHIGPRTSFVLWESMLQRLMEHETPAELSVLFAGGIHDARSAAMVSVLASPLVRRGAKAGVLMGTGYVFTEEATRSGAIKPGFQAAALACDATVLLETAPGHSTRCADTAYVAAFRAERERLTKEGVAAQAMWEALETLNLGRLRVASKGLVREGDRIVEVDEATQRREGMIMLGQVAALRDGVTTIAALHEDVSAGAERIVDGLDVAGLTATADGARRETSNDIAIVGMAAIMPKAPETADYWSNIVRGIDCVTEVPADRWNAETFFDPASRDGEKTPSKMGGFIDPVPFDPLLYGIPPFSLAAIDPVQLLSLEVSRRALADAGYGERFFDRERTSVIFGAEAGSDLSSAYGFRALWRKYAGEVPPELDAVLPTMTEDSFAGILSNVISGRIANRLDLGGVNYTVDAACAASLAAVNLAMKELTGRTSDMVICGGADLHNGIVDYLAFSSVHALGASGQCRTFDAAADGIALGEGVAAIVLKRLADAERDGDRIYAVVKAVGGASDGKSLGLTAPRAQGQVRTLERAYREAGVSPADVQLVEAHGTGTVVGDRTELESLNLVFRREDAAPGSITLGSVKSQVGHTKCTAGIAGLIKVALALYNRVLPATLNISTPNPGWDASSPFSLNASPRPWPGSKRRAGVSAFGFGGTNFHAVLEEYETRESGSGYDVWPSELFLFRGATIDEARGRVEELRGLLPRDEAWRLRDLARSASAGSAPVQIAVVAGDVDDLRDKLEKASRLEADAAGVFLSSEGLGEDAKVAFLYPGQGSQSAGMLRDLFLAFPELQRYLELDPATGAKMFPPTAWDDDTRSAQRVAITDTRAAQPSLGIAALAATDLLQKLSITPDMVAGHSYGELPALQAAGVFSPAEMVRLSALRAECILEAAITGGDSGTMAAVAATPAQTEALIAGIGGVVIANLNSAEQTVISGTTAGVTEAVSRLKAAGVAARALDVACAFHSPVVAAAAGSFHEALSRVEVRTPSVTAFSNTAAEQFSVGPEAIRRRLADQIAKPVQFHEQIEAMYAAGGRVFIEAGPGRVLTGLTSRILGSRPHVAVAIDGSEHGVTQLQRALARLAVAGVAVDHERLYEGRDARLFALDVAPSFKPPATAWWVDGQRAWPVSGEPPAHAMLPVRNPIPGLLSRPADSPAPAHVNGSREAVVLEYLRSTRELVETQRRIMLGYLGADPGPLVHDLKPAPLDLPRPPYSAQLPAGNGNGHQIDAAAAVAAIAGPQTTTPDTAKVLLAIISERTGYPVEMLGLELDLEADLSIDSIKRIEILGALADKLGLTQDGTLAELSDDLVRVKTLRGILDALAALAPAAATMADAPAMTLVGATAVASQAGSGVSVPDTRTALLDVVSARTGYPVEMLDLNLNLEADLSIDSIKRIEILGALAEKLGLTANGAAGDLPEELVRVQTLQGIIDAFAAVSRNGHTENGHATSGHATSGHPNGVVATAARNAATAGEAGRGPVPRFVTTGVPLALTPGTIDLGGKRASVLGDGDGVSERLRGQLAAAGANLLEPAESTGTDCYVDLSYLKGDREEVDIVSLFQRLRSALVGGAETVVVAAGHANRGGVAGMMRTLAKEWPERRVKAVILDALDGNGAADCIFAEVVAASGPIVVTYTPEGRFETRAVRKNLDGDATTQLDGESIVLITGGARGITAQIAVAIAERFGCALELVGRTPEPVAPEDADLSAAPDLPSLRRALIARGTLRTPAAIEAECARIMAEGGVRETLAKLRSAGSDAVYHVADVRDAAALGAVLDDVYARRGRIDLAVHAAGVIEDKLAVDKTAESFRRVFETKATGARVLAARLRDDGRLVFFSSIAGAFGNRGQVDYATANDFLDCLAEDLNHERPGRAVSMAWGPWAGGGMVSPELEREYALRGVELIEPEGGIAAFLSEVRAGTAEDAHVLLMRAFPSGLA